MYSLLKAQSNLENFNKTLIYEITQFYLKLEKIIGNGLR